MFLRSFVWNVVLAEECGARFHAVVMGSILCPPYRLSGRTMYPRIQCPLS